MNKLIKLVINEQMKLYLLRSTWIMLAILTVLLIGSGILANNFTSQIDQLGYTALHFVQDSSMFILLISLFTIIVAAGSVANEHRWGTIKLLLIRPISRATILLSKYISVLVFAITLTLFTFILSFLIGSVFFGFESSNLIYSYDDAQSTPLWKTTVDLYVYPFIELIILMTLAFMISTIFRNNSMALGATLFLMFTGSQLVFWFSQYDWSKYILFAHTDLRQYTESGHLYLEGNTLPFSLAVIAVYYVIFIGLSWFFFTKRDVAGH